MHELGRGHVPQNGLYSSHEPTTLLVLVDTTNVSLAKHRDIDSAAIPDAGGTDISDLFAGIFVGYVQVIEATAIENWEY